MLRVENVLQIHSLACKIASHQSFKVCAAWARSNSQARRAWKDCQIAVLTQRLTPLPWPVESEREAAINAFLQVAGLGAVSLFVSDALISSLKDCSLKVRVAAVKALTHFADDGSPRIIAALSTTVESNILSECIPAMVALFQLSVGSGRDHISKVFARLKRDNDFRNICNNFMGALTKVANKRDVIETVLLYLDQGMWSADTILVAVAVLMQLSHRGNQDVVRTLSAQLHHSDVKVRLVVVNALGNVADASDQCCIEALIIGIHDNDVQVRIAAAEAFVGLHGKCLRYMDDHDLSSMIAQCQHCSGLDIESALVDIRAELQQARQIERLPSDAGGL